MRARWLRFGLTLGVSLGVVGLALAIGMTRGNAPGVGAQGTTPTPAPTLPSGDAPSLPSGGGVTLATPTPTAASTPSSASTPEISDDSHLGHTTPTATPVVTAIRQTAPTPATPETMATTLPSNPPTCTTTTLGGTRAANALLAADCDTLLAIESTLAGTDALNWAPGTALTSWEGITVGGTPKRVTQIVIHGGKRASKLNGTLATQLGNLTGLRRLDLNDHSLTGAIPTQLGKLTALTYIDLADNALTERVPTQLEALTKLEYLWLWKTKLSGPLPTQLRVLTKLRVLSFNGASLSGEIPTQVGNLTALTEVALGGNSLSGEIPTELGSLTALTRLELQNNSLSGAIPPEMGNLTKLTLLRLSGNTLTGCVPNVLWSVSTSDLNRLQLSSCTKPTEIQYGQIVGEGTYYFDDYFHPYSGPYFVINVGSGRQIKWKSTLAIEADSSDDPMLLYVLSDMATGSDITYDAYSGAETHRTILSSGISGQSDKNGVEMFFDSITNSARMESIP